MNNRDFITGANNASAQTPISPNNPGSVHKNCLTVRSDINPETVVNEINARLECLRSLHIALSDTENNYMSQLSSRHIGGSLYALAIMTGDIQSLFDSIEDHLHD